MNFNDTRKFEDVTRELELDYCARKQEIKGPGYNQPLKLLDENIFLL